MKVLLSLSSYGGPLYHSTTAQAALSILQTKQLQLAPVLSHIERKLSSTKQYFASFTRSFATNAFSSAASFNYRPVTFVFRGRDLAANNKIVPVDYFRVADKSDDMRSTQDEMEERLLSNRPKINLPPIVKIIVILEASRQPRQLRQVLIEAKKQRLAVETYATMKDFVARKQITSHYQLLEKGRKVRPQFTSQAYYKRLMQFRNALDAPVEEFTEATVRSLADAEEVLKLMDDQRRTLLLRPLIIRILNIFSRKRVSPRNHLAYCESLIANYHKFKSRQLQEKQAKQLIQPLLDMLAGIDNRKAKVLYGESPTKTEFMLDNLSNLVRRSSELPLVQELKAKIPDLSDIPTLVANSHKPQRSI